VTPFPTAVYGTEVAVLLGAVVSGPALWMAVYSRSKVAVLEVETKLSNSEMMDYLERLITS